MEEHVSNPTKTDSFVHALGIVTVKHVKTVHLVIGHSGWSSKNWHNKKNVYLILNVGTFS